jgi:hypothetical protein
VNTESPPPGQPKAEGPPGFLDTRQMLIDADKWRLEALRRNQNDWANNPAQLAANKSLIDVQYEQRKAGVTLMKEQLKKNVEDWVKTGGPGGAPAIERPPPDIWNQLDFESQRKIDSALAYNAKGRDRVTDMATYYMLERMAGAAPGDFANVDLMQHYGKLANKDFEHLSGLQRTALGNDPTAGDLRDKHAIVKDAATAAGLIKPPSQMTEDAHKKLNDFYSWIEEAAGSWAKQNGRKPNGKEWQAIVDGVTMKIPSGSVWTGDKPVYEMTASDIPAPAKQQYLSAFVDRQAPEPSDHDLIAMHATAKQGVVPPSVVPVLGSELKKRGRAVTPQTLLGAWRLFQSAHPGTGGAAP